MSLVFHGDESEVWAKIRIRLYDARIEKGLSLRQLANIIGVDYSLIFRVEQGGRRVSLRVLDTWCEALGLPRFDVRADLILADLSPEEITDLVAYCLKEKGALKALDQWSDATGSSRYMTRAYMFCSDLSADEVSLMLKQYQPQSQPDSQPAEVA